MSDMWQKIVLMVRKTGERCIIFDAENEEAFVVMEFAQYEAMLSQKTTAPTSVKPTPVEVKQPPASTHLTQKTAPAIIEPNSIPLPEEAGDESSLEDLNSFAPISEEIASPSHSFYLEPIE